MVIYLSLSLITGYETFNNWHFTRSVLNHFVSRLSFIGLHTIIALGLHGLKRSKCIFSWETSPSSMVEMSNSHHVCSLVSFKYLEKGKTVAKVQILHFWELQTIWKREVLWWEQNGTFPGGGRVQLHSGLMTLSKALSLNLFFIYKMNRSYQMSIDSF